MNKFAVMQLPSHISQIILETERLILKEVNPEIIDHVFTQWTDEDIMRYMGLQTADQLAVDREKQQGGYETYRIKLKGFLFILKETNEVIGAAHYHTWQPMHSRAEIGYAIYKEEYKNKGYMKEGVKAILGFGFEEMGLNRIEALIGSNNVPSIKLVEGFGFKQEGVLREHYCKNGVIEDSLVFSLLKREYNPCTT